jgi:hypothetical protein
MTITHGPKHHPSQDRDNWYSSRKYICPSTTSGNKPWVWEGTQLDLPDIIENKVTPRIMKGFTVGGSWLICKNTFLTSVEPFKSINVKLIIINLSTTFAPILEQACD